MMLTSAQLENTKNAMRDICMELNHDEDLLVDEIIDALCMGIEANQVPHLRFYAKPKNQKDGGLL